MPVHEIVGGVGTLLVLIGLYRTTTGVWTEKSLWYELDHFVGLGMLIYYLVYEQEYYGVIINLLYAFVVFKGLTSYAEKRAFHKKRVRSRK